MKKVVPTALKKVKELKDEIKREVKQKEKLGELLLRKLVERPTDAAQLRDDRPASREAGKRKPTSPPGENFQRNKVGRTTKSPHLYVSPPRERSASSAYSQDGKEPRSPASSRFADSEDGAWELNPSDRRKRHQLLRRAQKNSANLGSQAALERPAPKREQKKKKKKKNKRKRKSRPPQDAVIIKPAEGKSFADVLKKINEATIPDEGPKIERYSKIRSGALLIKFKGKTGNTSTTTEALKKAVDATGTLQSLPARTTVKVFDLNSGITVEQVQTAVKKAIPELTAEPAVTLSHPNQREQVIAFVTLPARDATSFTKTKALQVGPFSCRLRQYSHAKRCYKCLGFGHTSYTCQGQDRKDYCYKCAEKGHKAVDCRNEEKCIACIDAGKLEEDTKHRRGTERCKSYREAWRMLNAKTKTGK